jgi:hypothetical protein
MELNSHILLLAYMVYLLPKHSLGYYLHSAIRHYYAHMYTRSWLSTTFNGQAFTMYMYTVTAQSWHDPLLFASSF